MKDIFYVGNSNNSSKKEIRYYYGCSPKNELGEKIKSKIAFSITAPMSLLSNLSRLYENNIRIRMFVENFSYFDRPLINDRFSNGRYNLTCNDISVREGYICSSTETIRLKLDNSTIPNYIEFEEFHLPIFCSLKSSCSGFSIRPHEIIRIDYSNKKNGELIWQHPDYIIENGELVTNFQIAV